MTIPVGRSGATPDTSIWLVIGDVPGEEDAEERRVLKALVDELKNDVEKKVREKFGRFGNAQVRPARAGFAKTKKLRIFVEES